MLLKETKLIFKNETPDEVKDSLWSEPSEAEIEEAIEITEKDKNCSREVAEELVRSRVEIIKITRTAVLANLESKTDGLTGLYNKRFLIENLEGEIARTNRHKSEISLMMMDMDKFKSINDNLGHPVGDSALIILSNIIRENIRNEDTAVRYGGEEFVVILPNTGIEGLNILGERVRKNVEERFRKELREVIKKEHAEVDEKIENAGGDSYFNSVVSGTISIGATSYKGKDEMNSISQIELVEKADKALYFSKEHGRNQVSFLTIEEAGEIIPLNKESLKNNFLKKKEQIEIEISKKEQILAEKREDLEVFKKHGSQKQIERTNESIKQVEEELRGLNETTKGLENKLKSLVA